MVCNGYVIKLVQSHDTEDCQPFNQVPVEATPNKPIQTVVVYQPPQTMDVPTNIKQILQEISSYAIKQIVPSDVNVIGAGNIP
jgi:hypothetical protein